MSKPNLNKLNVNLNTQNYTKQPHSLVNQFNTAIAQPSTFINNHGY